jgi:hypothetical protein
MIGSGIPISQSSAPFPNDIFSLRYDGRVTPEHCRKFRHPWMRILHTTVRQGALRWNFPRGELRAVAWKPRLNLSSRGLDLK